MPEKTGGTMRQAELLEILRAHPDELSHYPIKSFAVFGSVARDEAHDESDIDLLVEFNQPIGLFDFVRLQETLTALLGKQVDLVTPAALHPSMRDQILAEAVYA